MTTDSIKELMQNITAFRDARNWKQFHNPKDLAICISLEAAELLEIFQWSGAEIEADTEEKRERIREELADVLMYCCLMADNMDFDIAEIMLDKMEQNNKKYPVEESYGKSDKYTAYLDEGIEK